MFNIIRSIIDYTQTSQYSSTVDGYMVQCCCALILVFTILLIDWTRHLFKVLIYKLK